MPESAPVAKRTTSCYSCHTQEAHDHHSTRLAQHTPRLIFAAALWVQKAPYCHRTIPPNAVHSSIGASNGCCRRHKRQYSLRNEQSVCVCHRELISLPGCCVCVSSCSARARACVCVCVSTILEHTTHAHLPAQHAARQSKGRPTVHLVHQPSTCTHRLKAHALLQVPQSLR
jgi:hypothetical protein